MKWLRVANGKSIQLSCMSRVADNSARLYQKIFNILMWLSCDYRIFKLFTTTWNTLWFSNFLLRLGIYFPYKESLLNANTFFLYCFSNLWNLGNYGLQKRITYLCSKEQNEIKTQLLRNNLIVLDITFACIVIASFLKRYALSGSISKLLG